MGTLDKVEVGSIILNMIENVPDYISGATLHNMIDNERYNAENRTCDDIPEDIPEKYQPAIISLSAAAVVNLMEMQGTDSSSIKLGDFTINKGGGSSSEVTSKSLREDGLRKLDELGYCMHYYKALG